MSRKINTQRGFSHLSDDEFRYAMQRDMVPHEELVARGLTSPAAVQAFLRGDDYVAPEDRPASGNHMTLSDEEIELIEERRRKAEEEPTPSITPDSGLAGDEEPEDYDEGWTNDERRAELARRDLSVEGKKEELIQRLLDNDREKAEAAQQSGD